MPFNPDDYEIIEPYKGSGKHVNLTHMNPQFMARFQEMADAYYQQTGKTINIDDAWRSMQTQAQAYASGKPGVARPGVSLHPQGLAMDLNQVQAEDLARRHLLQDYGFVRPVGGEPWHIQMADFERRAPKVAATMKKKKFNPDDWEVVEEQPAAPQPAIQTQETKQQPQPSLQGAIEAAAKMPSWKRGSLAALVDAAKGAGLPWLIDYAVGPLAAKMGVKPPAGGESYAKGLEKAKEVLKKGQEKATGGGFGPLETVNAPGWAAMTPAFEAGQMATVGALSKVPGVNRIAKAAQELPGLFKRGAGLGAKAKGALARGATGAGVFPGIDFLMHGQAPTGKSAAIGAGFGALLGPGVFKVRNLSPTEPAPTGAAMGTSSMDIEAAINEQFGLESKAAPAAEVLPPTGAPSPLTPEKVQNIAQSVSDKMGTGNPGVSQIIKQIQKLKELPPWQRYGVQ